MKGHLCLTGWRRYDARSYWADESRGRCAGRDRLVRVRLVRPILGGHQRLGRARTVTVLSTEHHRQVLQRFDALLGAEDLTELDELCTPDMVNHALAPDRPAGLAGTRRR